jgi:L-asparaginase
MTTGGTIATVTTPHGTTAPEASPETLISALPEDLQPVRVEERAPMPSWAFGPDDMISIALRAREIARDHQDLAGLVVTHGTSTMEYTAYLTELFLDTEFPVVFTGAMRSADDADGDGPGNLRDACTLARVPGAGRLGVVICLNGEILSARDAHKRHRHDRVAFADLRGRVGTVSGGQVLIVRQPVRAPALTGVIDPSVAIVKAYPGSDGSVVDAVVARGARGVVVEGLPGVGGIPVAMQDALRRHAGTGVLIVISSRAPSGHVPSPPTGGTGEPLAGMGLLSAGSLTTEKAWVLLMACLGQSEGEEAARLFAEVSQIETGEEA